MVIEELNNDNFRQFNINIKNAKTKQKKQMAASEQKPQHVDRIAPAKKKAKKKQKKIRPSSTAGAAQVRPGLKII